MSYGVTSTGFVKKTLSVILGEIYDDIEAEIGLEARQAAETSGTAINKVVGIVAERLTDQWELAEAVYNGQYTSTAVGSSLDNAGELTGVVRQAATYTVLTAVLTGTVGTTIGSGSKASTSTIGDEFETTAAITLALTVACGALISIDSAVNAHTYRISIDGTNYDYVATVPPDTTISIAGSLEALINAGSDPVTATDNLDGTLTLVGDTGTDGLPTEFTLAIVANMSITTVGNLQEMQAINTGPVVALADTLTTIVTAVGGWTAVNNPVGTEDSYPTAALLGRVEETDAAYRIRRADSLANPGASTVDAIYAAIAAVLGVTDSAVVDNRTDATDANGLDPHSLLTVALGGLDESVADGQWAVVPAGIGMNSGFAGITTEIITDSQGFQQPVSFLRPTTVVMDVRITYTLNTEEEFPTNGEDLMKAAALAYGQTIKTGKDVLPHRFVGPVMDACTGIKTVLIEVQENGGGPWQSTPFTIDFDELSSFSLGNITVV